MTENMTDIVLVTFAASLWWMDRLVVLPVTVDGDPGWRVSGTYRGHAIRFENKFCCAMISDLRMMRARIDAEYKTD